MSNTSNVKQVLVIRRDLNMRKGKMISQGAHASIGFILDRLKTSGRDHTISLTKEMVEWIATGQKKITVSVDSEAELLEVYQKAKSAGLPATLIRDAGHTEFKEPTLTAVAIGPDESHKIDKITGELKLL